MGEVHFEGARMVSPVSHGRGAASPQQAPRVMVGLAYRLGLSVRRRSRRSTRAWLIAVLAVTLVAAGCTRPDDQLEIGAGPAPGATTPTSAAGSSTSGSGSTPGTTAPGPGDFGTLKNVCGPGDAASGKGGATAQGVTADQIRVATFSDVGFAGRPGLNQELFDAADVFTKWCNAAGGINGRKIKVDKRDAKLTEYKQRVTESCRDDFMMVGGGGVFDDSGQDERLKCLLPDIPGYLVTPKARGADLAVVALPTALNEAPIAVYKYLAKRFPDSTSKIGFLTGNVPATVTIDKQNQEAVQGLGWKIVYRAQYNAAGEASWTPIAQAMLSAGVRGFVYTGEPENLAKLLQAADDIGFKPDWVAAGPNHYDAKFISIGGAAVKNVFMSSSGVPFFDAGKVPAVKQYLDLFAKYAPKGKARALLAVNAFSAWLLFAKSVESCGANVTRRCVYDAAQGTTAWTGGGLHATTDPGAGKSSRCAVVLEASSKGFAVPKDFTPNKGVFRCDNSSVATLKGDYGKGATLASVGKSIDDLK